MGLIQVVKHTSTHSYDKRPLSTKVKGCSFNYLMTLIPCEAKGITSIIFLVKMVAFIKVMRIAFMKIEKNKLYKAPINPRSFQDQNKHYHNKLNKYSDLMC